MYQVGRLFQPAAVALLRQGRRAERPLAYRHRSRHLVGKIRAERLVEVRDLDEQIGAHG